MRIHDIQWGLLTKEPTEDWSEGLSTYIEIFSPKRTVFSPIENTSQKKLLNFLLHLFYAIF